MFDPLFVARAQLKSAVGTSAAAFTALSATAKTAFAEQGSNGSVFKISELARRSGALNQQLDRIELAHRLVSEAQSAARDIAFTLARAKAIAEGIQPTSAQATAATTTATTAAAASSASAAAATEPVTVLGSISLATEVAAGGAGDLVLGPVSATGSVQLLDDAVATATGTQDVASSSNLLLDTSVSQSETLTIDAGNGVETIVFGILGGQVNTASDLEQAIDAIDGVEAAYNVDGYLEISGEDADVSFTVGGTADVQAAFGIAEQTYDPFNLLDQGIAQSETLVFQVGADPAETITFGTGGSEVSTLAELGSALAALTGVTASLDGSNSVTFAALSASDTVTVSGSAGALASLGLEATTYDPDDLLLQGIAAGETLTFQVAGEAVQTIIFGNDAGEVNTVAELNAALGDLTDVTASIDGQDRLSFTVDDVERSVTVGGTADVTGVLGVAKQSYGPFNLLDQGLSQGQTLTVAVGGSLAQTITFGTGAGEVDTLSELAAALTSLTGLTGALDGQNRISLTAASTADTIVVGGTADVEQAFGIVEQEYANPDPGAANLVVTGVASPLPVADPDAATRSRLNDELSEIPELVAGAGVDLNANLVNGFTHLVRFSARDGDEATIGGQDLSLAGLGLALVDKTTFASEASKATLIGRLDAAIARVEDATAHLEADGDLLDARSNFASDINALIDDTSVGLVATRLDLEGARQLAIETRKALGQRKIKSALGAGAVSDIGRQTSVVFNQLVGSAFSGDGGRLFAPVEFTASPAFQRLTGE